MSKLKISTRLLIKSFENLLEHYEKQLQKNPGSFFHEGLVKNTKEFIQELKDQKK